MIKSSDKQIPTRANSELAVLESPLEWLQNFQRGWLAHLEKTGQPDWDKYQHPLNQLAPSGKGIDLASSRLLVISTAGGYLKDEQQPFNASDPYGDYSTRLLPTDTDFSQIVFTHEHYDHQYIDADPQVLLPLRHLEEMAAAGQIGELAPVVVSYSGYQPNVIRVTKELVPAVLRVAKKFAAQAALLVPS